MLSFFAPGVQMKAMASDAPVDDEKIWDVVIVGTGMGGAVIGHALSRQGRRVLFLERGEAEPSSDAPPPGLADPKARLGFGLWPDPVRMIVDGQPSEGFAAVGCAVGGSTRLYAAALERFAPSDFQPEDEHPAGAWPISYAELAPFYAEAEALFRVRGTGAGLGENPSLPLPPPSAPADAQFAEDFERAGLHPYRLHVGIDYLPGCTECLGTVCPRACKSDAADRCIAPALATGHAELRSGCEVVRIESQGRRVTGVVYRDGDRLRRAGGQIVILSAGALRSPALLLLSSLANSSGLVGRNLMFHASDWIALWPSRKAAMTGPRKTIALRDFYRVGGTRFGLFQSVGLTAGYGNILIFLYDRFDRSPLARFRPLRALLRIPAWIGARLFGQASIFALIMEDMPYRDNRIELDPTDPGKIVVRYDIAAELAERGRRARALLREKLGGLRHFFLWPRFILDTGHPCGTCRFGDDPGTSVLDRDCRTHDIDNLFVVDASFMPSSAGANPSLTIAANALRVAQAVGAQLDGVSPARSSA